MSSRGSPGSGLKYRHRARYDQWGLGIEEPVTHWSKTDRHVQLGARAHCCVRASLGASHASFLEGSGR